MGRPLGSPNRDKRFKAALVRYADADPVRLDEMAQKLWATAMTGDVSAMREVADRLDGKVPQAIVGDEEHGPVQIAWLSKSTTSPDSNSSPSTTEPSASPVSSATDEPEKP